MSFSYSSAVSTNLHLVRFLIRDTTNASSDPAFFSDEEIGAALTMSSAEGDALKFTAAARCLDIMIVAMSSKGKNIGLIEKSVETLKRKWGIDGNALKALQEARDGYNARAVDVTIRAGENMRFRAM